MSKREANAFLGIIDLSFRCRTEDDLCRVVLGLRDLISFEFALCVLSKASCRSTDPFHVINVSYPVPWLDLYFSRQFDGIDPVVAEHRLHPGLQYWADSYRKHPEAREFISAASAHGLKTGYSYGLKSPRSDNFSLFCFGGRSMRKSVRTALIVESIVPHLHLALIRIASPLQGLGQDIPVSPREKEVLKWVKAGKTSWEISRILSVSECTINFHIQHILRKVHAVTRAQAVAICMEGGLIDID